MPAGIIPAQALSSAVLMDALRRLPLMPSTFRSAIAVSPYFESREFSGTARGLRELEINSLKEPAMNRKGFGVIVASTLLGWAGVSFAQTSSYGSGESKRCNTKIG